MRPADVAELAVLRAPAPPLDVVTHLFERLHAEGGEGIRYCHWKSNEHLYASMVGGTDLDVLVDRRAASQLTRIFGELGIKRFAAKPFSGYPGIEDYVAFDSPSGKLLHVHVHYQLTLGEKRLKGYHLPWEDLVLSTRVLDETHGVSVCDPNVELLLVVIRVALKLRVRDIVGAAVGRPYLGVHALRELRWLTERADRTLLQDLARRGVGAKAAERLAEIIAEPVPSRLQLLAFRLAVEPSLGEYRLFGVLEARRRRWARESRLLWWMALNRLRGMPARSSRTLPQGGLIVALVGASGAGKSTVAARVADWLSWEVMAVLLPADAEGRVNARRVRGLGAIAILDEGCHERANGRLFDVVPPDLVVKLEVSLDVARARRPETPPERLRQQVTAVERLRVPPSTRVVVIDAAQPLEATLLQVKQTIWEAI
jgi:hypothetical protein